MSTSPSLDLVHEGGSAPSGQVIFLHGLGGHPRTTWQANPKEDGSFWPGWLCESLPHVDVCTVGYDAPATGWGGEARGLIDRAQTIAALLFGAGRDKLPTVFVCHSLGGLVVKEMLFQSATDPGRENGWVQAMTRGVAFLATPHAGSRVADWAVAMGWASRASEVMIDLQTDSAYLQKLASWYTRETPGLGIDTVAYCETLNTKASKGFFGKSFNARVVERESANPNIPGVRMTDIEADHIQIAKPIGPSSMLYKNIKRFIGDVLTEKAGKEAAQKTSVESADTSEPSPPVENPPSQPPSNVMSTERRPVLLHADEDKTDAQELRARLHAAGYATWISSVDVLPGQNQASETRDAIAEAPLLICCFSSKSVKQSGHFQKELRAALSASAEKPAGLISLIPVKFDHCEIPPLRFDEFGVDYRGLTSADLFEVNGFQRLLYSFENAVGPPQTASGGDDADEEQTASPGNAETEAEAADRKQYYENRAEEARSWFLDEVTDKLEESVDALNALDQGDRANELDVHARARSLAAQFLDMTAEKVLDRLYKAHHRLERRHPRAAAVCCEVTLLILPAVYNPNAVQDVRDQMTDQGTYCVELHASIELVADLLVAAAIGRPIKVKYPHRSGEWPKGGVHKLDLLPILDRGGLEAYLRSWDEYLWGEFGDHSLKYDEEKDRIAYLKGELRYRARRTPPVVYYVIMPDDEGQRAAFSEALRHLAEKYPDLLVLALKQDGKLSLKETEVFRPLRDILFRQGKAA